MTLYKLYKSICCNHIGDIPKYKSSELKPVAMCDRLIISLKSYDAEKIDNQLSSISRAYFELMGSMNFDIDIVKENLKTIESYQYKKKPDLCVDINTLLSVIYINNDSNILELTMTALKALTFKRKIIL